MARYIDVDKFAAKICNFQAIDEDAANKMVWLLRTFPTADVVPKSEVEEIFEEIEKAVEDAEFEWGTFFGVKLAIAELKKKYAEGNNGVD